ncbi:MAG: zinc ABC transporter substrate-binding protein [Anaerolineae bacterium]|nr:zinc ABC transporter substrate-binding protein [Anaerolineae bacterium]
MKFRIHRIGLVLAAIVLLSVAGCSAPAATDAGHEGNLDHVEMLLPDIAPVKLAEGEKLSVVATTSIIGDVVANVGSDAIDLTVLMAVGQDPHSYEPTPRALAAIEDADIIFVNGLDLEEVLMGSIENTATGVIVPVSAGIEPLASGGDDHEEGDDHHHAAGDPHFWVDPNNLMVWVENIEQVLSEADPGSHEMYQANAEAYHAELEALDAYIREQVTGIPEENRKLVTDHGLYGYFAEEYGFEIVGLMIDSFSTTAGTSAGDVARLAEVIQEEDVPAIFIGTTASQGLQNLAEAIAEETGEKIKVLPLLTGSLAPEGEPGDTYLGYMQYNIDQIASGLAE